jgi:flagellar biosynthesis protein FliR
MLSELLTAEAFRLLLIFVRVGSAMAILPGLAEIYVAGRVRLLLAFGLSLALAGPLTRISQCAQTARITSGGRFHPESCRFGLVAGKRPGWVTGPVEALRQRPPWAVERSSGP